MIVAKVIDTVISTRKHSALLGLRLLAVEPVTKPSGDALIAGDLLGAGIGEYVLVTCGSNAAGALDKDAPVDAMVVGILDQPPAYVKD